MNPNENNDQVPQTPPADQPQTPPVPPMDQPAVDPLLQEDTPPVEQQVAPAPEAAPAEDAASQFNPFDTPTNNEQPVVAEVPAEPVVEQPAVEQPMSGPQDMTPVMDQQAHDSTAESTQPPLTESTTVTPPEMPASETSTPPQEQPPTPVESATTEQSMAPVPMAPSKSKGMLLWVAIGVGVLLLVVAGLVIFVI